MTPGKHKALNPLRQQSQIRSAFDLLGFANLAMSSKPQISLPVFTVPSMADAWGMRAGTFGGSWPGALAETPASVLMRNSV
jgi:hypothetical protein